MSNPTLHLHPARDRTCPHSPVGAGIPPIPQCGHVHPNKEVRP